MENRFANDLLHTISVNHKEYFLSKVSSFCEVSD